MEYGHVCFSYSKNEFIPRAIAWFTKSRWSHSFITIPNILKTPMAMEAASSGVTMAPFDKSYRDNPTQKYEIYKFKCSEEQINQAIDMCLDELQTTYGFLEYPWFMWRSLNKFLGRDIKHQDNWIQQGIVCSGFTRHFISFAGYEDLFSKFGKNSANAEDIYEIVINRPDLFEKIEEKQ